MKNFFPFAEYSTRVFITVVCGNGAEFVKKKQQPQQKTCCFCSCDIIETGCQFFFLAGERLRVDLWENESNWTFICNSVLWQYIRLLRQYNLDSTTHNLRCRCAPFCANANLLTKWSLVQTLQVTEVGLFFSCSCMLKQFC